MLHLKLSLCFLLLSLWRQGTGKSRSPSDPSREICVFGEPVDADGTSTVVEFTLTEITAGTLLRVVETGFASLHGTAEEQDKAVQENTEGWSSELAELKEYAERRAA